MVQLYPLTNVLITIQMLLGRFLALTSTKTSLNERMWRASEVVKRKLASVIGTFNLVEITSVKGIAAFINSV